MNIQSILALDLVGMAFALIPGLQKAFDSLISKIVNHNYAFNDAYCTYDDDFYDFREETYQNIKNKFQAEMCKVIQSEFKLRESMMHFFRKTIIPPKDIVFNSSIWFNTLNVMSKQIMTNLNKDYYDLQFAVTNLSEFATKLRDYMINFAKENKCEYNSDMYRNKCNDVAKSISETFKKNIELYQYYNDDYEYNFETSSFFTKYVTATWINSFDEYIRIENAKFDNSDVSFQIEDNEKEQKRTSYERRKKNAHAHNKGRKVYV